MSRDTLTQACSFHCKICGRLTATRSRWHVDNEICEEFGCDRKTEQITPQDDQPERGECLYH